MGLTPSERLALKWLLAIITIGSGAKLSRQWRYADAVSGSSREALARQLVAVDSAQRAGRTRSRVKAPAARRRREPAIAFGDTVGDGAPVRRRTKRRVASDSTLPDSRRSARDRPILELVDLDRADSAALERLPRIGPALAARIIADRTRHGAFGSLTALERVRGIGPKLAQSLAPVVTFSTGPRPFVVQR
jgi:hypothetical protein